MTVHLTTFPEDGKWQMMILKPILNSEYSPKLTRSGVLQSHRLHLTIHFLLVQVDSLSQFQEPTLSQSFVV